MRLEKRSFGMENRNPADLARALYAALLAGDRDQLDALLQQGEALVVATGAQCDVSSNAVRVDREVGGRGEPFGFVEERDRGRRRQCAQPIHVLILEVERLLAGSEDAQLGRLEVEPNTPIGPGETRAVRLRVTSKLFADERIVPTHAPQQFIAGLLRFQKAEGAQQMVLVRSNIIPTEFGQLASTR